MAIDHEEAQWIVMLGLIVSFSILFLALVINQSILVGQTTAESALEFPKYDIQDLRSQIREIKNLNPPQPTLNNLVEDIKDIAIQRKGAIIEIEIDPSLSIIHYNNGVTLYDETIKHWDY